MQRIPWLNLLVILLVIIAGLYLAQLVWQLLGAFGDIILLFVLAWLVSFTLGPLIERINGKPLPPGIVELADRFLGKRIARQFMRFRTTRFHAVAIVYLVLASVLIGAVALLASPVAAQLTQLVGLFQTLAKSPPDFVGGAQGVLSRLGLRIDVESALVGAVGSLQNVATTAVQNAVVILGGVVTLIGSILLVLFLSFFFALDGPRLFQSLFDLIPEEYDPEVRMLTATVDKTFGGFIRVQLLQAFLVGAGTGIVTALFGQPLALVGGLFAGFFMLIPFVGAFLALVPPFLTTIFYNPDQLPVVIIVLLVYQLVVVNVVMPNLLSEALGLHPLVVMGALLLGTRLGGVWGAFFGVPVAGVIASMALYLYRRRGRQRNPPDKSTAGTGTPAGSDGASPPTAVTLGEGTAIGAQNPRSIGEREKTGVT